MEIIRIVLPAFVALLLLVTSSEAKASGGVFREDQSIIQYSETTTHSSHDKIVTLPPGGVHPVHDSIDYDTSSVEGRSAHGVENGHSGEAAHHPGGGDGHHGGIHVFVAEFSRVEMPFKIALWILLASLAKIVFHMAPKLSSLFPESCLLIVVGLVIGLILFQSSDSTAPLTPDVFFFYMLPPIILDAGYFMPNRLFFDHLGTILLFAVIGTVWNVVTIGLALWGCGLTGVYGFDLPLLDTFLFASLISAVDPVAVLAVFEEIHVNEVLYIVVFGESLLNDAVTVVLYKMFEGYGEMGVENVKYPEILKGFASFAVVALGGTLIGIIWGFVTGFITRFTNQVRVIEPIFIFVMSYLAYLNAEIFHMSGILAITFCGITMKNYVEGNISPKSHTTIKYTMKMLSSSSETIIFIFLGVNTVNDQHDWNTAFILLTILFCCLFRAIGVVLLTDLANQFRLHKLDHVEKFVMSYGGLRGAVAFALALLIKEKYVPQRKLFVTATISVVYFTVFFQGMTIKPLVKFLKVKRANKREKTMNERITEKMIDYTMAGMEDVLGHMGNLKIRDKFKQIDNKYIRPCLIREATAHEPKILETYSRLAKKDAMELMKNNASSFNSGPNSDSMGVIFRNYAANTLDSSANIPPMDRGLNLDIGELAYSPSGRDLSEAKVHHMLAEDRMWKPQKSFRRLSYSRHAVRDSDLSSAMAPVNRNNMHFQVRRMVSETVRAEQQSKLIRRKREEQSGRQEESNSETVTPNVKSVSVKENGMTRKLRDDYLRTVIKEVSEAEERGQLDDVSANELAMAMKGPNGETIDPVLYSYQTAITELMKNEQVALAGFLAASAMAHMPIQPELVPIKTPDLPRHQLGRPSPKPASKGLSAGTSGGSSIGTPQGSPRPQIPSKTKALVSYKGPGATGVPASVIEQARVRQNRLRFVLEESRNSLKRVMSLGEPRPSTPTAAELELPWKRNDGDVDVGVKQSEFPPWVENKEYMNYSPSSTFIGGLDRDTSRPSVVDIFPGDSSDVAGPSDTGSEASPSFVVTVTVPGNLSEEDDDNDKKRD